MPQRLLSVSEFVDRCSPPNEHRRTVWLRRARDWSNLGLLNTRRQHEGSGHHRLFNADTAFLAAVMFRMADQSVSARLIYQFAGVIRGSGRGKSERELRQFWQQARGFINSPFPGHDAHLAVALAPESGGIQWFTAVGPIWVSDGAWVVLNLTRTFREVQEQQEAS